jgi:hypothetical protein
LAKKYLYNNNNLLINYFINNKGFATSSMILMYGKPTTIPDILNGDLDIELADCNNLKTIIARIDVEEGETRLPDIFYEITLLIISKKIETDCKGSIVFGLVLVNSYIKFMSNYYWNIGTRIIKSMNLTDPNELTYLLILVNNLLVLAYQY